MLVVSGIDAGEEFLAGGDMRCPSCGGVLRGHGHARTRTVRGPGAARLTVTPRRVRCRGCRATHVLLPGELTIRRADATAVIGSALMANAEDGHGFRRIAADIGRPASTVRRWLRAARDAAHVERLYQDGAAAVVAYDIERLPHPAQHCHRSPLWRALNLLAAAAMALRGRFDMRESAWALVCLCARGRLLAPPPLFSKN